MTLVPEMVDIVKAELDFPSQMRFTSGLPETLCGAGSTLANTRHMRGKLIGLLHEIGVESILDAPCGDFNWMNEVNLEGIDYIGADLNDDNLLAALRRAPQCDFRSLDIVNDDLPYADLMLCRDFHQHLPDYKVLKALYNFRMSGIPWLLTTTHNAGAKNIDIDRDGMFRPINLLMAPFNFPEAQFVIEDPPGSNHFLCLWHRDYVPC